MSPRRNNTLHPQAGLTPKLWLRLPSSCKSSSHFTPHSCTSNSESTPSSCHFPAKLQVQLCFKLKLQLQLSLLPNIVILAVSPPKNARPRQNCTPSCHFTPILYLQLPFDSTTVSPTVTSPQHWNSSCQSTPKAATPSSMPPQNKSSATPKTSSYPHPSVVCSVIYCLTQGKSSTLPKTNPQSIDARCPNVCLSIFWGNVSYSPSV